DRLSGFPEPGNLLREDRVELVVAEVATVPLFDLHESFEGDVTADSFEDRRAVLREEAGEPQEVPADEHLAVCHVDGCFVYFRVFLEVGRHIVKAIAVKVGEVGREFVTFTRHPVKGHWAIPQTSSSNV